MATIAQKPLFRWEDLEELGDIRRLELLLKYLPDEPLMRVLETHRGKGRDDYPVRAMWNAVLAGVVFQHESIEKLRRELNRNAQLRECCGFEALKGIDQLPSAWVYTRFLKLLMQYESELQELFEQLVERLSEELPDFGKVLAIDGKAIPSHGKQGKPDAAKKPDGRRESDANFGVKSYAGKQKDGTLWKQVTSWFGFKLHLVVDAEYELPVAFEVTQASVAEQPEAKVLIDHLEERQETVLERCEVFLGDKGYDTKELIESLWEDHGIKSVIDIRNCWKESDDGEGTRVLSGQTHVIYDYRGTVCCTCPSTGEVREMAYGGFEQDRETLKYRCPAKYCGVTCAGRGSCPIADAVRIKLEEDRRIFTPIARSSYVWETVYKKRSAVERVNSRLDVSFGFEQHFIRGLKKMNLRVNLALVVMLGMALGRVKENQRDKIRSLVQAA